MFSTVKNRRPYNVDRFDWKKFFNKSWKHSDRSEKKSSSHNARQFIAMGHPYRFGGCGSKINNKQRPMVYWEKNQSSYSSRGLFTSENLQFNRQENRISNQRQCRLSIILRNKYCRVLECSRPYKNRKIQEQTFSRNTENYCELYLKSGRRIRIRRSKRSGFRLNSARSKYFFIHPMPA